MGHELHLNWIFQRVLQQAPFGRCWYTISETNSSHLKIGLNAPKGNNRIPTIFRCELLVSGTVNDIFHWWGWQCHTTNHRFDLSDFRHNADVNQLVPPLNNSIIGPSDPEQKRTGLIFWVNEYRKITANFGFPLQKVWRSSLKRRLYIYGCF